MGRLAMVTGASSGIGEAFAARLAADGWDLLLVARRRDRLEEVAARLTAVHGVSTRVVDLDLADPTRIEELSDEAAGLGLELLVNNAALAHYMPFATLSAGSAQELVQLNVLAPVLLTRAVLPSMLERDRGAVINVASLLAFSGSWDAPHFPKRAVYAASKSFLVTFTQILAAELLGTNVRVQVLCPGVVRTEFHTRQGMDLSASPRMEADLVAQASLEDLARGVVVSIPGAEDVVALEGIKDASADLVGATRAVELPERYG